MLDDHDTHIQRQEGVQVALDLARSEAPNSEQEWHKAIERYRAPHEGVTSKVRALMYDHPSLSMTEEPSPQGLVTREKRIIEAAQRYATANRLEPWDTMLARKHATNKAALRVASSLAEQDWAPPTLRAAFLLHTLEPEKLRDSEVSPQHMRPPRFSQTECTAAVE